MLEGEEYRKPKYFFALFGKPSMQKPPVESGRYVHKGYIDSQNILPGDVMLLYCTLLYDKYSQQSPGIGIVTDTSADCVYYQYFPFNDAVNWYTIQDKLKEYSNRLQVLQSRGNWLF